jgi:hypothetical protein
VVFWLFFFSFLKLKWRRFIVKTAAKFFDCKYGVGRCELRSSRRWRSRHSGVGLFLVCGGRCGQ